MYRSWVACYACGTEYSAPQATRRRWGLILAALHSRAPFAYGSLVASPTLGCGAGAVAVGVSYGRHDIHGWRRWGVRDTGHADLLLDRSAPGLRDGCQGLFMPVYH